MVFLHSELEGYSDKIKVSPTRLWVYDSTRLLQGRVINFTKIINVSDVGQASSHWFICTYLPTVQLSRADAEQMLSGNETHCAGLRGRGGGETAFSQLSIYQRLICNNILIILKVPNFPILVRAIGE